MAWGDSVVLDLGREVEHSLIFLGCSSFLDLVCVLFKGSKAFPLPFIALFCKEFFPLPFKALSWRTVQNMLPGQPTPLPLTSPILQVGCKA